MVTWLWKLGLAELILLLLCWDNCAMEVPLDLRQPPTITKQSAQDHIVDPRDSAVVECEAKGNPAPAFSWKRNGRAFQLGADPRVSMRSRSGTLDIAFYSGVPPEDYEGEYQCFANNDFGTAVSSKINLRVSRAPLWPKEVLEPVAINQGLPLVLPCNPPPSLPPPHIFWMNSSMMPIIPDRRISVGLNGDLYFSNVLVNDSRTTYSCNARYAQTIQQKNPFPLKVLTTRLISESLPRFLSPTGSASTKVVLRGEQLALECIAAGVPTPYIRWYKRGGELPIRKLRLENFNKTLRVLTASDENSGEYVCSATNRMGTISHTIVVRVEAAPTWLTKPTNLVLPAEQNGRLVCRANGVPKPTIQWMVNGEPVERVPLNPRRQVEGENLVLRSVQTIDSAVYQCNASNDHGYLLANAFISIQESSPRILSPRNQLVRVVQNSRASLECIFFGSPIPQLRWSKDGQVSSLEGGSYKTYHNGTLEIQRAKAEDRGYYTCAASNVLGRAENQVRLEVKDPTKITRGPKDPKPIRGSEARLECRASHDESLPVTVTWLRNNKALSLGWRLSKEGDFLVIPRVQREDEGNYTCIVRTELDRVSASARLTVFDRPDPPTDLELSDPSERSIRLTWIPGDDNHSPVTEFLVQYEEDYWEPRWWKNLTSYPGNLNSVMLQLRPFVNYQFRVIAINAIGPGRPSRPSQRYKTGGAAPDAIPRYIRGIGTWRTRMVIRWEALRNIERNGPHLRYLVWWRRRDSREEWKNTTTYWLKHIIYDADTFTPYEIKVQAMNDFGVGPESDVVIGYSGEDRPIAAPTNLRVSKTDSTRATLHWDPVPQSTVLGILKEYKVYYWRDRSLLKWLGVSRRRNSMGFNTTSVRPYGVLTGLIPYSNYKMYMVVANNRYEGPPSSTIEFQTTEGVPSPPRFFSIQQRHLDTFYLEWDRPAEPNGIITGYTLKYHRGNGTSDGFTQQDFPPNTTYYTLRRPDRYTRFKFSLAARTQVGIGEANVQESPLFTNEAYSREQVDLATQGWFIGMMCAVALLVVILLIVCFIKKSRGGKYPVRDKKDLPLDTVEPKDQNGSFDYRSFERINRVSTLPYNKRSDEDHRPLRSSQISLDGMVKMQESDDSLVDYGEGGDGQFNEDGSFIGQYIARKDRDETEGISPSANSPINAIYSLA